MPKKKILDIRWPTGGLDRRYAYRSQRPFTTPDCLNVRPTGAIEGRERGGSRPGLGKAYFEELGSGSPVNMLSSVVFTNTDARTYWQDNFRGSVLGDVWSAASWIGKAPEILNTTQPYVEYEDTVGAVRDALSDLDTSKDYLIETWITPFLGQHCGTFRIFARMDNTTPDATDEGIIVELTMEEDSDAYSGKLIEYNSGTPTEYAFTAGGGSAHPLAGWLKVLVSGDTIKVYWQGTLLKNQAVTSHSGSRFGFGMECSVDGGLCLIDTFRIQYFSTNPFEYYRRVLVAASGGNLYRETWMGILEQVSTNLTLVSDHPIQAAERAQKLYIADWGEPIVEGDDGVIAGAGNNELDAASHSDWTTIGANIYDYVVIITNGTGSCTNGTYAISAIAAGQITLSTAPGAGNCSYRIERAPKIYDPLANTLTLWSATSGQVPSGCKLICRYRDRMALAAADNAPHLWYLSRQSDPLDFDYGQEDVARAVAGQNSEAGEIGEPIRAMIPHSDDYLVFASETDLWLMRGDPAYGGMIDAVDRRIGVIGPQAWCFVPGGAVCFLSRDGLYLMAPGSTSYPQDFSRDRLPREMLDVDPSIYVVSMEFDTRGRGIHIFLTPKDPRTHVHYFVDWENKGFWPDSVKDEHEPWTQHYFEAQTAEDSNVLLGCRDGYIRSFSEKYAVDDGEEIPSRVTIGPIRMGGDYSDGILNELIGVIGDYSGDVDWEIYVGNSDEQAVKATVARESGTWSLVDDGYGFQGTNYTNRPRVRAGAFCLRLKNGEKAVPWALERVTALVEALGKHRLL